MSLSEFRRDELLPAESIDAHLDRILIRGQCPDRGNRRFRRLFQMVTTSIAGRYRAGGEASRKEQPFAADAARRGSPARRHMFSRLASKRISVCRGVQAARCSLARRI